MSAPASAPPAGVVVPTSGGSPQPGSAMAATPMKGGMLLSPLPLTGGRKRKSRKITKKMLKMLKKNPTIMKKLAAMKGGEGEEAAAPAAEGETVGARRRRTRRGTKRRSGLLY